MDSVRRLLQRPEPAERNHHEPREELRGPDSPQGKPPIAPFLSKFMNSIFFYFDTTFYLHIHDVTSGFPDITKVFLKLGFEETSN